MVNHLATRGKGGRFSMCIDLQFCEQCENDAVRAWSDAKTHEPPRSFGDNAQRATAVERRAIALECLARQGDFDTLSSSPEWQEVMTNLGLPAKPVSLDEVRKSIPRPVRSKQNTRRSRHRHWRAERRWDKFDEAITIVLAKILRRSILRTALRVSVD